MSQQPTRLDITRFDFEEFVRFLFDHEAPPRASAEEWYCKVEVNFGPTEVVEHYIRLFTEPEFLLDGYTPQQLEQGFWAIPGPVLECSVRHIIWLEEVLFERRATCVRSMRSLFEKLFSKVHLETADNMWWDSLCYDWHCGNRVRSRGGEDQLMQDVIFETLGGILRIPVVTCQKAALHGLGHLHHPGTEKLVHEFLKKNPHLPRIVREYARAAAQFRVM